MVPFEKNQIYASYRNSGFYASTSMAFSNMTSTTPKKDTKRVWYSRVAYAPYYNDQDVILFGINSAISKTDPKNKVMGFNQRPENSLGSVLVGAGTLTNVKSSNTYLADLSLRKGALSFQSAYGTTKINRSSDLKNSKIHGGYAQLSYSLTGEVRAFDPDFPGFANIKAAKPFDLRNGHFGAFEAKYRFSYLNFGKSAYDKLGGVSLNGSNGMLVTALTGVEAESNGSYLLNGGRMTINTVGINWYTNDYLTFMLDYSLVSVKNSQIWGAIYKIKQEQENGMPAANHKPRIITLRASVKI
jgi:phosphate-selective porin OprO/OprP